MACRDRSMILPKSFFKLYSCAKCYSYLFPRDGNFDSVGLSLKARNNSIYETGTSIIPDIDNKTVVTEVCKSLSSEQCKHWTNCCRSAITCCTRQLTSPPLLNNISSEFCPRTWDGYACFNDTPSGSKVELTCPSYIENVKIGATAVKTCTENGTWYRNPVSSLEWTDYTKCVSGEDQHTVLFIGLAFNIISIILLLVACGIFLAFRQLRVQQRIILHLNLFLSFVIYAVITILWDFLLVYDRLNNHTDMSRMYQNGIFCKVLYIFLRYARSSNYFWMVCEGYYLHTLIVHAFKVPKSLTGYFAFGWGACWIPVGIYSLIRATQSQYNIQCWVPQINGFEWIIYTPNLLCIIVNIYFFINILRILLTQLQTHPNEPSNYRRAFKATFVLVPLFGIQFVILVYRPNNYTYDIIQSIVKYAQGAIISLIFCLFNGEVHAQMKNCLRKHCMGSIGGMKRNYSNTSATQYTNVMMSSRNIRTDEQNASYMPLNKLDNDYKNEDTYGLQSGIQNGTNF